MGTKNDDDEAPASGGFSEAELAGLSDEERAALTGDDEDRDSLEEIAGGAGGTDADDDADPDAEAKAAAKQQADDKAAKEAEEKAKLAAEEKRKAELAAMSEEERKAAEAADAKAAQEAKDKAAADAAAADKAGQEKKDKVVADDGDRPFVAKYTVAAVEDYEKQVTALDAEKNEATAAQKAGDMSVDEMLAVHSAVDNKRRELDAQRLKAEIAAEQNEQNAAAQWQWEINRFMRNTAKNEGIDYRVGKDSPEINRVLNAELDAQVKILGSMPGNADKDGEWFLAEAHKRVKAIHGLGKQEVKEPAKPAAEKSQASRQAPTPPKTLSSVPAAVAEDAKGSGEFAHLDALEGIDLEMAVARLTPEQQDRYART